MRFFTSHWRSPLLKDLDATIVSISRGQPRRRLPFAYRRLPELAPGKEAWAQEEREAFERAYLDQLEELGARAILERLETLAGKRATVLVCWERLDGSDPGEWCHRTMLSRFLGDHGLEVRELAPGDLPEQPDAPQEKLF